MSIFLLKDDTLNVMKFAKNTASMENQQSGNGPKRLINRHEFVRVIIQCLYALGYSKSASCLESESGISYKSAEFELLESYALNGNWDGCIDTLAAIMDLTGEMRTFCSVPGVQAVFVGVFELWDDSLALSILRKKIPTLHLGREKAHNLAHSFLNINVMEFGNIDECIILELRKKLLLDLKKLLPPPIVVAEEGWNTWLKLKFWPR